MRLFAGIELDEASRAHCADAQARLRRASFEAAYDAPEKLHVTLAFLGNVSHDRVLDVESALSEAAGSFSPFDVVWDRVSAFPNERRPRIVFVGSRDQGAPYRALAHELRRKYRLLGFAFDDDALAHVTIARVKGGSPHPLPMLEIVPHVMTVREIALFESLPGETTTRYEIRKRAALADG
jgi:RNA 2',3'-cyclic 3'-phosphodiesterase